LKQNKQILIEKASKFNGTRELEAKTSKASQKGRIKHDELLGFHCKQENWGKDS
jgi:hypothetical protein